MGAKPKFESGLQIHERRVSVEDEFDFGFTIESENDELSRAQKMYSAIEPFLNKLQQNPEKDYIYWPDRDKKINEFKKKLIGILNG